MFRWAEIAVQNNERRFGALSQYMADIGLPNEVQFVPVGIDDLSGRLPDLLSQVDGVRVGQGLGEVIVQQFNNSPVLVQKLGAADCIEKNEGTWWLRCHAVAGMTQLLASAGERFDLNSSALIVGAGAAARIAVTALFRMGFTRFSISSLNEIKVEQMIKDLERSHFGAKFSAVPKEGLILLPGTHGVLVNTTPLSPENPMLAELNYFNFFKTGGIAIDFSLNEDDSSVLVGAKEVGAYCIHGYEIAGITDALWCESVFGRTVSSADLTGLYAKLFRTASN